MASALYGCAETCNKYNTIQNKYELLANLNEESDSPSTSSLEDAAQNLSSLRTEHQKKQRVNSTTRKAHTITITGDSHVKTCATELQHNLGINSEVSSFVKSGAGMSVITNTAKEEINNLKSEEVVVVWGGSNDINRDNAKEALKYIGNFVEDRRKVNIVIMNAPHRYDLIPSSCVNNEIVKFNRQSKKKMKIYDNVKILETDLDRKYFTKHGRHLNLSRKEQISLKLAAVIYCNCSTDL
jgi:hypothetical protein